MDARAGGRARFLLWAGIAHERVVAPLGAAGVLVSLFLLIRLGRDVRDG